MNRKQTAVICATSLVVVLCLAVPPYTGMVMSDAGPVSFEFLGHRPIISPPDSDATNIVQIDNQRIFMQIAGVVALGIASFFALRD